MVRAVGEHTGLVRLCDGNYHGWRAWGEGVLPMERYRAELEAAGYAGPVSLLLPGALCRPALLAGGEPWRS